MSLLDKLYRKIILAITISLFWLIATPALAILCYNVNVTTINKIQCLRICLFDTDKQEYRYIHYYKLDPALQTQAARQPKVVETIPGVTFYDNGEIKIDNTYDLSIESIFQTFVPERHITVNNEDISKNYIEFAVTINNLTGSEAMRKLMQFSTRTKNTANNRQFGCVQFDNGSSQSLTDLDNDEKRQIGELATYYTMFGYGYTSKLPPSGPGTKGFDGVFISPTTQELFITDSKCTKKYAPQKLLIDSLNQDGIATKLKSTPEEIQKLITLYLSKKSNQLFRLLQKVDPYGRCHNFVVQDIKECYEAQPILATLAEKNAQINDDDDDMLDTSTSNPGREASTQTEEVEAPQKPQPVNTEFVIKNGFFKKTGENTVIIGGVLAVSEEAWQQALLQYVSEQKMVSAQ